uniref:Uncharacterized protein n=1 Tax=Angiostrongylus cantonensis TaxID=6313 RepID=A0A0K0DAA3_ANGCA
MIHYTILRSHVSVQKYRADEDIMKNDHATTTMPDESISIGITAATEKIMSEQRDTTSEVKKSTGREKTETVLGLQEVTGAAGRRPSLVTVGAIPTITAKHFVDETATPLKNYVDVPYVFKYGKSKAMYGSDGTEDNKRTKSGYAINVKAVFSEYRKRRASEYVDEHVTPSPYEDSYALPEEQIPALLEQGYSASEAPPVKPAGYRKKRLTNP